MATIQKRPFSKNYSGLINQSVIAVGIVVIAVTFHEYAKRKRRGKNPPKGLGSVESWQYGYLYQGRSWAKKPSPPIAQGWPLSWVRQALSFPEDRFNELRGVDASLYIRFLKGCAYFAAIHTFTTFPILLPIHVHFSDDTISPKSMTRASISSLVNTEKGVSLLWIHLLLLIWVTFTWVGVLLWICRGMFRYRAAKIKETAERAAGEAQAEKDAQYHPHPHPQYPFQDVPSLDHDHSTRGLRMRTVMVTNIPPGLRSEQELKEYFEYYMSRSIPKPTMGVTSAAQPGFIDRNLAFVFNKGVSFAGRMYGSRSRRSDDGIYDPTDAEKSKAQVPVIDRVVIVRKMSELASLLERREEVLRCLETAHIKLAENVLDAVYEAMHPSPTIIQSAATKLSFGRVQTAPTPATSLDMERAQSVESSEGEDRMHLLIRTLSPFLEDHPRKPVSEKCKSCFRSWFLRREQSQVPVGSAEKKMRPKPDNTIWDALLSLPRSTLDAYQPLIHLSALFRGKTVPAIDYYTAKLNLLTSLITEERALPAAHFAAGSTAFVTFADPADARRACKYLAVHPNNPVNACLVTMAPSYEDLDWTRLMKSTYRVEFVKDWVVNLGVWAFTIFWVFPVTSIVGLVSIQNISAFWPGLKRYLDRHEWQSEVLQSFVPTLLTALLTLLIPLILLLIAKKAHTIITLSALHDRIMTRYYKFLIVNILVFFCVGTAALQSFLVSFKATTGEQLLTVISDSFPTAGPFYVGWLIFTMGIHSGLELGLFGLPLLLYPTTKRQVTPRKRAVGIRPRTFNFYYWLPNHLLVVHILLLFAVLNPLVLPFGLIYFLVESAVVKNQLLHVYAKNYEGNGQALLVRMIRYSLDGLILAQAVFLAYMVVLKIKANVGVAAVLIILTVFTKIILTRFCRVKFERDDLTEARILCGILSPEEPSPLVEDAAKNEQQGSPDLASKPPPTRSRLEYWTWKVGFSYNTVVRRHHTPRHPNPFRPRSSDDSEVPLEPCSSTAGLLTKDVPETSTILPSIISEPIHESPREVESPLPEEETRPTLVVPHPPHPRWNDESNPDTPYDNPYYTRPITDSLWLPRDPLGILDLDDTVDVRISLTSEPGAGKLGAWHEDEFLCSALSSVFATSFASIDADLESIQSPRPQLSGSEDIALPAGIASRVDSSEGSQRGESASMRQNSSHAPRRFSSTSGARPSGFKRPPTLEHRSSSGFRSFSLGAEINSSSSAVQTSPSHLTVPSDSRRGRSSSVDAVGLSASSPDRRSQFSSPAIHSALRLPRYPTMSGNGSVITTHEAVVGEAIAEEQVAAQERLRQEAADEERAKEPRSWLTSWLYARTS